MTALKMNSFNEKNYKCLVKDFSPDINENDKMSRVRNDTALRSCHFEESSTRNLNRCKYINLAAMQLFFIYFFLCYVFK